MVDTFTRQKRSEIMRCVKSRGNKTTELRLIEIFKEFGIKGWRRNYKLKGNPDFVFLKERIAIFTDGCFWHGHGCRNIAPSNNKEYWKIKITKNKIRDKSITKYLSSTGWKVIRVWECELAKKNHCLVISKLNKILLAERE